MSQWKASWRAAGGQGGNPWHVGSCAPVIVSVNWGGGGTPEGEGEREGGGAGGGEKLEELEQCRNIKDRTVGLARLKKTERSKGKLSFSHNNK